MDPILEKILAAYAAGKTPQDIISDPEMGKAVGFDLNKAKRAKAYWYAKSVAKEPEEMLNQIYPEYSAPKPIPAKKPGVGVLAITPKEVGAKHKATVSEMDIDGLFEFDKQQRANFDSLKNSSNHTDQWKGRKDLYNYLQDAPAKIADIVSKRDALSDSDWQYVKTTAPKVAAQLANHYAPQTKGRTDAAGLVNLIRSGAKKEKDDAIKQFGETQKKNIADNLTQWVGEVDMNKAIADPDYLQQVRQAVAEKHKQNINQAKIEIERKTGNNAGMAFGANPMVMGAVKMMEYESSHRKAIESEFTQATQQLDLLEAYQLRLRMPNASPQEIGRKVMEKNNPDAKLAKGGSRKVNREAEMLGLQADMLTGEQDRMMAAEEQMQTIDDRHPDEKIGTIMHKLSAEHNRGNTVWENIGKSNAKLVETDKYANQFNSTDKAFYYKHVRPILENEEKNNIGGIMSLPSQDLTGRVADGFMGTATEVVKFLAMPFGFDKQARAIDRLDSSYTAMLQNVGESPVLMQQFEQLAQKEKDGTFTPEDKVKFAELKQYVDTRKGYEKFIGFAGDAISQAYMFGALGRVIGGAISGTTNAGLRIAGLAPTAIKAGKVAGAAGIAENMMAGVGLKMGKSTADAIGLITAGYTMSLPGYQAKSEAMFEGKEGAAWKTPLYANTMALFEGVSELIIPDTRYLDMFNKQVSGGLAELVQAMGKKGVTRSTFNSQLKGVLKGAWNTALNAGMGTVGEISEEVIIEWADFIEKSLMAPEEADIVQTIKNSKDVAIATGLGFLPMSIYGAYRTGRRKSADFLIPQLAQIGRDATLTNSLIRHVQDNTGTLYTPDEAKDKLSSIAYIQQVNKELTNIDPSTLNLSAKKLDKWVLMAANEKVLYQKAEATKDPVIKAQILKEIKESQDGRNRLVDNKLIVNDYMDLQAPEEILEQAKQQQQAAQQAVTGVTTSTPEDLTPEEQAIANQLAGALTEDMGATGVATKAPAIEIDNGTWADTEDNSKAIVSLQDKDGNTMATVEPGRNGVFTVYTPGTNGKPKPITNERGAVLTYTQLDAAKQVAQEAAIKMQQQGNKPIIKTLQSNGQAAATTTATGATAQQAQVQSGLEQPETAGNNTTNAGVSPVPQATASQPRKAKQLSNPISRKAMEGTEDDFTPLTRVMRYFIGGGKISAQAIQDLFGGGNLALNTGVADKAVTAERQARIGIMDKNGPGIKELAERIWAEIPDGTRDKYTDQDFREAVEKVLNDYSSTAQMAKDLAGKLEKSDEEVVEWYNGRLPAYEQEGETQDDIDTDITAGGLLNPEEQKRIIDAEAAGNTAANDDFIANLPDNPFGEDTNLDDLEDAPFMGESKDAAPIGKEARLNPAKQKTFFGSDIDAIDSDSKRSKNIIKVIKNLFAGVPNFKGIEVMTEANFAKAVDSVAKDETETYTNREGNVYGFVHPDTGKILLNDKYFNANTPVHEASHVFIKWLKANNKTLHDAMMAKTKGSYWEAQVRANPNYAGKSNAVIADEALAWAVGAQGNRMSRSFKDDLVTMWQNIKDAILGVTIRNTEELAAWASGYAIERKTGIGARWSAAKAAKDFENATPEQVAAMSMDELAGAVAGRILSGKGLKGNLAEQEGEARMMIVPAGSKMQENYEDMAKTITDKRKLWAATGVEELPDGRLVRDTQPIQIPDETIKAFKDALDGEVRTGKLGDMVDLGELADLYPELKDVYLDFYTSQFETDYARYAQREQRGLPQKEIAPTIFVNGSKSVAGRYFTSGYFKGNRPGVDTGRSGMGSRGDIMAQLERPELLSKLLTQLITHEIQHYVQKKEKWQPGANLKNVIDATIAERYRSIMQEANPANAQVLAYIIPLDADKVIADRATNPIAQEIYREAYETYLDVPGEIEARNSAIRSGMSDSERARTPISESGDTRFMAGATLYTPTTPEQKETRKLLDAAKAEYDAAKGAYEKKKAELMKSYKQGVVDLFGQTPEERGGMQKLFDEKPQLKAAEKALQPFKTRMDKAAAETNRLYGKYQGMEKEASKQMTLFMVGGTNYPTRRQAQKAAEQKFEADLLKYAKDRQFKVFELGPPSEILLSTGVPDLPIEMASTQLSKKQDKHDIKLFEITDLPGAIARPLAVFQSKTRGNAKLILTEMQKGNTNYVVALHLDIDGKKAKINDIRSLYPKDNEREMLLWIVEDNLLEYADKTNLPEWLNQRQSHSAEVVKLIEQATKIVQDFENPSIPDSGNVKFMAAPLTNSEAFKKWFGDSKVVNPDGSPMVVYHGTMTEFTEFAGGAFFTDDYMNADGYAGGDNVMEVYLKLENPLIINARGRKWDNIGSKFGNSTREITANLDTDRYDGVIFNNIKDSWIDDEDYQDSGTVYYVANPNQVKSATGNRGTFSKESNDIRFMIAGPTGAARMQNAEKILSDLKVAKDMGQAGKDPLNIRLATGWEKGADSRWKYEIPDITVRRGVNKAVFNEAVRARLLIDKLNAENDPNEDFTKGGREKAIKDLEALDKELGLPRYQKDLMQQVMAALKANDIEALPITSLTKRITEETNDSNSYEAPIKRIIEGEFAQAYPNLMNEIKIGFAYLPESVNGQYNYKTKNIQISEDIKGVDQVVLSTLLHELQHAIQHEEGFAKGGNDNMTKKIAFEESKKIIEREYSDLPSYKKAVEENKVDEWVLTAISATGKGITPFEAYRRLAGEVESRNVQKRMYMNADKRRQTLLQETEDVRREDQIVLMDAMNTYAAEMVPEEAKLMAGGKVNPAQLSMFGANMEPIVPEALKPQTKEQVQQVQAPPKEKIEDYGEKIGGAKKDLARKLNDITQEDIINQPLSKSFPEPDYKQLVDDKIISKEGAKFIKYLYQNIPAKPRKPYLLRNWVNRVQEGIDMVKSIVEDPKYLDTVWSDSIRQKTDSYLANAYEIYSKVMDAFDFPNVNPKLGGYEIKKWTSSKDGARVSIVKGSIIIKDFDTIEAAARGLVNMINATKETASKKAVKFGVYQDRKTLEYFIAKATGTDNVRMIGGFTSAKDTFAYLKENQAQLEEQWYGMKLNPEERPDANTPRNGRNWRKGKDITAEEFAKQFGFRGIEFGNWVNQGERQVSINEAYDALMDLSGVMGLNPKAISLNGKLGLAFGARGSGKANAHFEAQKVVINLTKTKGAGSLAHEWWHAMDNYFSRMRGTTEGFVTASPRAGLVKDSTGKWVKDERIRPEVMQAYKALVDAINATELPQRSLELDKTRSNRYWSDPVEMTARTFENFIINKLAETGEKNDYLANFKEMSQWVEDSGFTLENFPYPTKEEAVEINKAYKHLADTIEEREDESGNVAMFMAGNPDIRFMAAGDVKRLGRSGLEIKFKKANPAQTYKGVLNWLEKISVNPDNYNQSRTTNSKYVEFDSPSGVSYDIRISDHTRAVSDANSAEGLQVSAATITIDTGADDYTLKDIQNIYELAEKYIGDESVNDSVYELVKSTLIANIENGTDNNYSKIREEVGLPSDDYGFFNQLIRDNYWSVVRGNKEYRQADEERKEKERAANYIDIKEFRASNDIIITTNNSKKRSEWNYSHIERPGQPVKWGKKMAAADELGKQIATQPSFMAAAPNTEQFKQWFEGSKVTNPVYHYNVYGDNDFTGFKPKNMGTFGNHSFFYFAQDKNWPKAFAKYFAGIEKATPRVFYLSIKNPLDLVGMRKTPTEWREWLNDNNLLTDQADTFLSSYAQSKFTRTEILPWEFFRSDNGQFHQKLIEAGYDGIIMNDSNYGSKGSNVTYVSIDPLQIRAVTSDSANFMAAPNQPTPIASDFSNIYQKVYPLISRGMTDAQMLPIIRAAMAIKGLDPLLADNILARAKVNYQKQLYSNPQPGSPLIPATQVQDNEKSIARKTWDFLKRNFTSSEGMPTWFKELADYARGESQWIVRKAENFLKQQLTPAFKKMTPAQQQGFAELIADKTAASANVDALTPEHKRLASEYRQHIDRLTNEFIVNGWVTPLQAQTLLENMGSYLNRSYRIFNEKDWEKKIPENVKVEALNFLKEGIFAHDSPNNPGFQNNVEAERLAQLELKRLLAAAEGDKFGFKTTEFGMDKGILKRRQDVPAPIRKLYGEYTDPAEQFIMTVAKLASLRMQAKYLTDIFNMGMGKVFWAKNDPSADPRATELVAADGSPSWAPLSGLYATPEVAQYINEGHEASNKFLNAYRKFAGTVKAGKTVYSPVTQAINLFSNAAWYIANGYYLSNPVTQAKDLARTTKLWFTNVFANSKATDYWNQRMIQLGLFDGSVTMQDLKNMFAEGDADAIMIQAQSNIAQAWGDKLKSGLRDNVITRSYAMADAASKFVGWRKESEALAWVRHNKDYDDLSATEKEAIEKEAAERVKNTQPTGQRAYRGALWLSKNFAIFGNFITFQIEAIRCARNVVHYALHDIKEGKKNGNAREVLMGTRRLVGIAGYLTLRGAILKGLGAIGGMAMSGLYSLWNDDDEEKKKRLAAINAIGRPYMRTMDKYMTQNEDGTWEVYNLNALEPMSVVFKIPNAFTNGNELVDNPGALAALTELVVPYAEPDMIVNSFSRTLIGEKDAMGREVYGPIDKMATIAHDLMPSAVPFVQRMFKKEDGRMADWNDIFTEMQGLDVDFDPRQLIGIRPYRVDPLRNFKTYVRDRLKDADAIKKREWENKYKHDKGDITDDAYFAEKQAIKDAQVALGDDIATMKQHAAVLGVNESEMNKIVKNMMEFSKYDKTTIKAAKQ
jgi:hypothetical protein